MDDCRFRDCKHDQEPGCAVQPAIGAGELDPLRFASLRRLVAEEAALEEEQARRERLLTGEKVVGSHSTTTPMGNWRNTITVDYMTALPSTPDMYDLRMSEAARRCTRK